MSTVALNTYKKVGIESKVLGATPARLIELLFEGASGAIMAAHTAMRAGDPAETGRFIGKASAIILDGLMGSLRSDQGGELASGLHSLYDYIARLLVQSQLDKNPDGLLEAKRLLGEVHEAWTEAVMTPERK
jgi:flagellar protein FliS